MNTTDSVKVIGFVMLTFWLGLFALAGTVLMVEAIEAGRDHPFPESLFADYATRGIDNQTLSLAVAGLAGVVLTLLVGYGMVSASRHVRSNAT